MVKSAKHTASPGPITWLAPLYADAGPIVGRRPRPEAAGPYPWLASLYLPERESRRAHRTPVPAEAATGSTSVDTDDEVEATAWMTEVLGRLSA